MKNLKGNWILLHDEAGDCARMEITGHASVATKCAMLGDALIEALRDDAEFSLEQALAFLCESAVHIYSKKMEEEEHE